MTCKDYILIANAINDAMDWESVTRREAIRDTARHIADALAKDNPLFDREKFLAACGNC